MKAKPNNTPLMGEQIHRRHFIKAGAAAYILMQSGLSLANTQKQQPKKVKPFVWILLRGGLDSLHTVMPIGDPDFLLHRGDIVTPIKDTLLPLNTDYAMHPKLAFMHNLYTQKQMLPIVAVASGYRNRSHFEAQDQMESGLNITEHDNGWLARALSVYSGDGLAISRAVPIALSAAHSAKNPNIHTWYPTAFNAADEDLIQRLASLYTNDEQMTDWLMQATEQSMATQGMQKRRLANFAQLATNCAQLMNQHPDTACAMMELNGWDTHNNMQSRLSRQFEQLDDGLKSLQQTLGERWQDTLVMISTEFGRTVALNGTKGSDHGTAGVMFFAGGAIEKNQKRFAQVGLTAQTVLGKWPGLALSDLYEGRDLMPSSDVRAWTAKALAAHWDLNSAQLSQVFPDVVAS